MSHPTAHWPAWLRAIGGYFAAFQRTSTAHLAASQNTPTPLAFPELVETDHEHKPGDPGRETCAQCVSHAGVIEHYTPRSETPTQPMPKIEDEAGPAPQRRLARPGTVGYHQLATSPDEESAIITATHLLAAGPSAIEAIVAGFYAAESHLFIPEDEIGRAVTFMWFEAEQMLAEQALAGAGASA